MGFVENNLGIKLGLYDWIFSNRVLVIRYKMGILQCDLRKLIILKSLTKAVVR